MNSKVFIIIFLGNQWGIMVFNPITLTMIQQPLSDGSSPSPTVGSWLGVGTDLVGRRP